MRPIAPILVFSLLPFGSLADETPQTSPPLIDGLDDLAEGMRQLFDSFSDEVAPMMEGLAEQLKGLDAYHAPEVLPNGDIIIRRKTPKELENKPDVGEDNVIDI